MQFCTGLEDNLLQIQTQRYEANCITNTKLHTVMRHVFLHRDHIEKQLCAISIRHITVCDKHYEVHVTKGLNWATGIEMKKTPGQILCGLPIPNSIT